MIAGSPRIMGNIFPQPEVLENLRSSLFSRTVTLTPGRSSATVFGVELFDKTSSSTKFGTSRTGRMPRALIYHWRTINFSENGENWRFSDRRDSNFAVRQIRHLRTKMVKNRGKLGYPSENLTFQDGGQPPPDLDNLDLTWWIPNWGIPTRKDSSDTRDNRTMQKAYLPMHYPCTAAWQGRQLSCLPKFLFVNRSTSGMGRWRGLILGVNRKILWEIGPRGHELWISEVPHYKSMGKWPLESDVLTLRCQMQL